MNHNVYLFQPQYQIFVGDEINYWLPYSIGCLWSYVNQFDDISSQFNLGHLFFKRDKTEEVLKIIKEPAVIGFSCYIWNEKYCLGMAEKIKEIWPDVPIVFGGPQVNGSYLKYKFIDSLVLAEGEESFADILRKIKNNQSLPEIYRKNRLEKLDIPSPYLDGTFDQLIKQYPEYLWATTVETNRGCPYACTFCDWGSLTYSKIKKFDLIRIEKELEWIESHRVVYLFNADANFGIFKERDVEISKLIRRSADNGMIEAVNLQFAKNSTDTVFEIGKILGPYNRGITVSVQSMNSDTLSAIKRKNLDVNNIERMMQLSKIHEVETYTEVILGLPLETFETWKNGLIELLRLGQHQSIELSFAELLENSELNSLESRKKYEIKYVEASQYYSIINDDEYPETTKIISATSTMDTKELVKSYLYAWMIIHMHINGYTQLYSKYLYNLHNVDYKNYYDEIFNLIQDNKIIKKHYDQLYSILYKYLTEGKFEKDKDIVQRGDSFHFFSHKFCYDHKEELFDVGKKAFMKFTTAINDIDFLQRHYILDSAQKFPFYFNASINIDTWEQEHVYYEIKNSIDEYQNFKNKKKIDFWALRRKKLLRNKIIKVEKE